MLSQARESTSFLDKANYQTRKNATVDDMQSGGQA